MKASAYGGPQSLCVRPKVCEAPVRVVRAPVTALTAASVRPHTVFISCLCHFPQCHSSMFCLDKLMNRKLASAVFLILKPTLTLSHTCTAVLPRVCVSLLPWMFSVTVVFKLHFFCLQLHRQALSPELHKDRIETASAVRTNVCICPEPV